METVSRWNIDVGLLSVSVLVTPRIRIDTQERLEDRLIECLAAEAVPAANLSWLLPKGVSAGLHWSNFTSHNGTHSVRAVLVLPVCLQRELSVECVIDHPAFEKPESRRITLSVCGTFNKPNAKTILSE